MYKDSNNVFLIPDCIPRLNVRMMHTERSKRAIMRKNEEEWARMRKKKESSEKDTATKPRESTSPNNKQKPRESTSPNNEKKLRESTSPKIEQKPRDSTSPKIEQQHVYNCYFRQDHSIIRVTYFGTEKTLLLSLKTFFLTRQILIYPGQPHN